MLLFSMDLGVSFVKLQMLRSVLHNILRSPMKLANFQENFMILGSSYQSQLLSWCTNTRAMQVVLGSIPPPRVLQHCNSTDLKIPEKKKKKKDPAAQGYVWNLQNLSEN